MRRYIGKRALTGIMIVLISVCFNFALIRMAPGDPITIMAGIDNPNPDMIAALQAKYGLDKPVFEQFMMFLKNVAKGDLGYSYVSDQPVVEMIVEKIGPTLLLSLTGVIISVVVGTILGIYAARKNGSFFDKFICKISYFFDAVPGFWLGLIMILIFASTLKILPTAGMVNLRANYTGFRRVLDIAEHLILPVVTLSLVQIPYYFRIARSSVLQVMSEDYITTLRATGMKESKIFNKYVLRNAILPTVTVFGMSLAFLISGTVLIETVFAWPGMGRLLMTSITKRDYPLLTGLYLVISVSIATMMILVDIVYGFIDPRIRYD
ncbi:ABC transporter permease [Clostridium polynesiense]|uniref:ABC transporter permease n=1 Tax=Clostridium polynesiense TaxID=1325933 RepID=UPI00058AD09A|nr:ABC transporter permease [Clostridium polynesiense]